MSLGAASSELLYFRERGSGPPLLLVHGLMVSGKLFEPVIEHFAARLLIFLSHSASCNNTYNSH